MPEYIEICPEISADHDETQYHIEVELPGVKKDDIDLEVGDSSFCIKAPKGDIGYNACYTLAHQIDTSKVDAKFENGLLTINAPFMQPLGGIKITVK